MRIIVALVHILVRVLERQSLNKVPLILAIRLKQEINNNSY